MQTVTKLAVSNNKENRSKSILVMLSIFMSTVLLTIIATIGYGLVQDNRVNAGLFYGDYYGTFRGVTEEQLETMKLRGEFTDIGMQAMVGIVQHEKSLALYCSDDMALSMTQAKRKLESGKFPSAENEIAAQPSYFKMLGIAAPKLGDTVEITYRANLSSPFAPETFVISGLLQEPKDTEGVNPVAYVSQSYYEKITAAAARSYNVYFKLNESVSISNDNGEEVIKELAVKCGIDERYASDNGGYIMWALNMGTETIIICVAIMLMVILFSVIVIYNILQVGIVRKIQEYGKIKALGATRKQMRRLIFAEGMQLAAIAIPLGLVTGFVLAHLPYDLVRGIGNLPEDGVKISLFSPVILLLVCLVSFLTVWLALKKPMRIVSQISPVEAIRYQESSQKKNKKGIRKGNKNIGTYGLTAANLTANKKRTVSTILTMGLSCVMFVVMVSFAGNMDAVYDARQRVEYGQFQVSLDYTLRDTAYPENNLDQILLNNPLNKELISNIKAIDGVTDVKTNHILLIGSEENYQTVDVMDQESFSRKLKEGAVVGEFDYKKAAEENGLIYGWSLFMEDDAVQIGESRSIELSNGTEKRQLTVPVLGSFASTATSWVITEDTYRSLGFEAPSLYRVWIDCEKGKEAQVQSALQEQLAGIEHLEMSSYQEALASSESAIQMTRGGLYALTAVIAVISFLNMANTLITSMITRKQEFGVLQAIGMTNAQLNQSLQMEGLLFTLGTVGVSLAAGIPLGILLFQYARESGFIGINIYQFPMLEIILMILVFAILQITLSFILTRNVKKESLIERIRYQG